MDESEAIRLLKQGDPAGLEALVREYQLPALRAAFLVVRERALAEDIVQAAFLKAYDRFDQFDERRPFGPWFLRIVINDAIKAATRRREPLPLDGGEDEAPGLADLLSDPAPGPEDQAQRQELRLEVWQAMERLAPEQRAALVLRYYYNLSESELAWQLRLPASTIKWRLHAARRRLARLLGSLRREDSGIDKTEKPS
jgi:RNA polymerase sigma-70 factor (ECF subfamily)